MGRAAPRRDGSARARRQSRLHWSGRGCRLASPSCESACSGARNAHPACARCAARPARRHRPVDPCRMSLFALPVAYLIITAQAFTLPVIGNRLRAGQWTLRLPNAKRARAQMTDLSLTILPETADDAVPIERLHERTFGPGRYAKSAYRLREGIGHQLDLSFTARIGTLLVGSVRLSPIRIGETKALLLGPLTVEPAFRERGVGYALIERARAEAKAKGHRLVVLVGDEPYYGKSGFKRVPPGRAIMPGPV